MMRSRRLRRNRWAWHRFTARFDRFPLKNLGLRVLQLGCTVLFLLVWQKRLIPDFPFLTRTVTLSLLFIGALFIKNPLNRYIPNRGLRICNRLFVIFTIFMVIWLIQDYSDVAALAASMETPAGESKLAAVLFVGTLRFTFNHGMWFLPYLLAGVILGIINLRQRSSRRRPAFRPTSAYRAPAPEPEVVHREEAPAATAPMDEPAPVAEPAQPTTQTKKIWKAFVHEWGGAVPGIVNISDADVLPETVVIFTRLENGQPTDTAMNTIGAMLVATNDTIKVPATWTAPAPIKV